MSDEPIELPTPVSLSLIEQRILGSLVEKQKTTAESYPMTVNALVTACNQKSNRDPVLNLTPEQVEETLEALNRRGLVVRVISGRADKWKHVLYEHWKIDKVELAVVAELFLRGPQTEGELRTRVSRMEDIPDLEALRAIVHRLAERRFAIYLTPEGRRGTIVSHGCQDDAAVERQRSRFTEAARLEDLSPAPSSPGSPSKITRADPLALEVDELRKQLADLRLTVEQLSGQVRDLGQQLGWAPPTG